MSMLILIRKQDDTHLLGRKALRPIGAYTILPYTRCVTVIVNANWNNKMNANNSPL
jgi:hypothetical protein